jgi:hypothetical protein
MSKPPMSNLPITNVAADDLPGAAVAGDGGRDIPSDAAAVRHKSSPASSAEIIALPRRLERRRAVGLAADIMMLPIVPLERGAEQ